MIYNSQETASRARFVSDPAALSALFHAHYMAGYINHCYQSPQNLQTYLQRKEQHLDRALKTPQQREASRAALAQVCQWVLPHRASWPQPPRSLLPRRWSKAVRLAQSIDRAKDDSAVSKIAHDYFSKMCASPANTTPYYRAQRTVTACEEMLAYIGTPHFRHICVDTAGRSIATHIGLMQPYCPEPLRLRVRPVNAAATESLDPHASLKLTKRVADALFPAHGGGSYGGSSSSYSHSSTTGSFF